MSGVGPERGADPRSRRLFHITSAEAWARAQVDGDYRAPSLATEGFIHLSGEGQWLATANRWFRGQRGLVLLAIDGDRLTAAVRWEPAVPPLPDGETYPHLYGPLALAAVIAVHALPVDDAGAIGVPAGFGGPRP